MPHDESRYGGHHGVSDGVQRNGPRYAERAKTNTRILDRPHQPSSYEELLLKHHVVIYLCQSSQKRP